MSVDRPTPRQLEVLALIADRNARSMPAPTFRELATALGLRSVNAVADLVMWLDKKGMLEPRIPFASRMLRVSPAGCAVLGLVPDRRLSDGSPSEFGPSAASIASEVAWSAFCAGAHLASGTRQPMAAWWGAATTPRDAIGEAFAAWWKRRLAAGRD